MFAACIALQVPFYYWSGRKDGEKYAAYLRNTAMSKRIGTLTPTTYGTLKANGFILITGATGFALNVIYTLALHSVRQGMLEK